MDIVKCYVVKPIKESTVQEVRNLLDSNGISYSHDGGLVFASLREFPLDLAVIATVMDPVYQKEGSWYFKCDDDDPVGPYDTENNARFGFKAWISWVEFVDNGPHQRNDA